MDLGSHLLHENWPNFKRVTDVIYTHLNHVICLVKMYVLHIAKLYYLYMLQPQAVLLLVGLLGCL